MLDAQRHDVNANNYEFSNLRTYLNTTFYNTAFFLADTPDTHIETTTVDNSPASTGYVPNDYACENTLDKVFALAYQEITNANYGFTGDESRKCLTTDYARAVGADQATSSVKYGRYYLRSPNNSASRNARYVWHDGSIVDGNVINDYHGLRPALWLDIKS